MSIAAGEVRAAERAWQERLLPLMMRMLVGLTLFFFIASFAQLYYLHTRIEHAPLLDQAALMHELQCSDTTSTEGCLAQQRLRMEVVLEANALARRYHQANVLLMSSIWTRYLGFVTGMILALVGAAFILGQLQSANELEAKSEPVSLTLRSASPGLTLSVLGAVLMITTIAIRHDISTRDVPIYLATAPPNLSLDPPSMPATQP